MNIPGPAVARPGMFRCSRAPGKGSLPSRVCLYRKPCRLLRPWKPLLDCCTEGNLTRSRTTVKRQAPLPGALCPVGRHPPGWPSASPKKKRRRIPPAAARSRGPGDCRAHHHPTIHAAPDTPYLLDRCYCPTNSAYGAGWNGTLNSRSPRPSSSPPASSTSPALA